MLALGTNFFRRGDHRSALWFYREVGRLSIRDRVFDPVTLSIANRMTAVIRAKEGDHEGALADLERTFSLARMASSLQPYAYYDYLNALAVELGEVGRLEQAHRASDIAVSSPFASAYPEWRETFDEIALKQRRRSRSVVAVPECISAIHKAPERAADAERSKQHTSKTANLVWLTARPPAASAECQPKGSAARVLDFQRWKNTLRSVNPAHSSPLTQEHKAEMTTGEKLIRLMDLISHDDTDEEMIDKILEAVERIVMNPRNQILD